MKKYARECSFEVTYTARKFIKKGRKKEGK
jgi:hypothetical protein